MLFVQESCHSCDHRASANAILHCAGPSIAFSSMPPERYPRSRYRPDGTRRRTANEWLARKGKGKGDGNTKGKEKVVAEEAKDMVRGSRGIVKTTGPDILRSIETTETAVTAITTEIASHKKKDTDVAEMHTEIGKSPKRKGGRPDGSPEERDDDRQRDPSRDRDRGNWTDWSQGWTWQNNRSWQDDV